MKNKFFKKALSVFTAMAMMVSVIIGNNVTAYAKAVGIKNTPEITSSGGFEMYYMHGYDTYIVDGTNPNTTAVYYFENNDANSGNRIYVNPNGAAGDDLSATWIWSNGYTYELSGDINIEMTGGSINGIAIGFNISGSGNDTTDVNINISGGSCGFVQKFIRGHRGNVWLFSEQKVPELQNLTGYVTKTDSGWVAHGDAIIPEGKTVTVGEGEVFRIELGATLTNNGTIVNNGTINTYAPLNVTVTGNGTVVRSAICINDTASSITVYKDGEEYSAQTEVVDGKTYIYVPAGEIKVDMDGEVYYAKYSAEAGEFETESEPKGVTDFTNMPTEIKVNEPFTLSAGMVDEWFNTTVTYEISVDGGTGAVLDGNVLTAYRAGTIQVTVTAKDTYDYTFSKTYEIVVAHTPVSDIETIPSRISVGINYNLAGYAVTNNDATYKTIEWSVLNANETGATITDNVIKATSAGTAVIRATVRNGQAFGEDYHKDYTIEFYETDEISVANGSIIISKKDENTVTITGGGLAEAEEYPKDEYITIIGTTDSNTITISEGTTANVILSNVSISSSNTPIDIHSGATLNLTLLGENTLTSNTRENAAFHVPTGAKLVITDASTGSLNATGGNRAAGIGGNYQENSGDVEIHGGTITATSTSGAGIGGGVNRVNGSVTITGGYVNAYASDAGAGIGSGSHPNSNAGNITISGGTVIASGTTEGKSMGAGIGGGYKGNGGTVVITGGNVKAISGTDAEAIGKGEEGTGSSGTLKDSAGNDISLMEIALDGVSDKTSVTNIVVDGSTYGSKDVVTIGDKLYLYLPAGSKVTSVTAGGNTYECCRNGKMYQNHSGWVEATCYVAEHCIACDKTRGETLPHNYVDGVCTICGIDEQGTFHIKTSAQLVAFAQYVNAGNKNTNAVLDADIDMTGVAWTPICQTVSYHSSAATDTGYSGTFDGNGHTISNLTVTGISGDTYSYGLFGTVSGTVKDLGMVNYTYTMGSAGDARAGSIVGQVLTGGTITNCYSVGHSVTTNSNIAGGIAGCTYGGTISNCYALNGSVSGYDTRWGGVVGDCQKDSTAPDLAQTYGTVSNCYTDDTRVVSSQSGNATISSCAVKNDAAFASGEIAYLLNNSTSTGNLVWYQNLSDNTDSYPVLNDTHGTVYSVFECNGTTPAGYSNVNENEPHTDVNPVDGKCDVCGTTVHTHEWTYTANDDTITAECGAADCPLNGAAKTIVISASDKTYDGTAVVATVENNVDTTDYSSLIVYKDNDGDVVDEAVNAGTYTANLTLTSANSTEVTASYQFEITKAEITSITDFGVVAPVAGETPKSSVAAGTGYTAEISWQPDDTSYAPNTVYTATVTLTADTNHSFADSITVSGWDKSVNADSLVFTKEFNATGKLKYDVIVPTANILTYNGSAQELVTAGTVPDGCEMQYKLGDDGTFSAEIPTATDANTYKVYWKVVGNDTYNDIDNGDYVEVTISKATPTAEMFTYTAPTDLDYDGNVKSATVTTDKVGMGDITIQYYKNGILTEPVECGIYSVKVSVAEGDNYTDATDLTADDWTFTINHVDADNNGYCDDCGAVYDGIGAHLAGYTLSLNGNIGVNFYMELSDEVANDHNAYMLFTLPDGSEKQVLVSEATQNTTLTEGKTYYVFSCEVSSYEMTQEIKAQMFDGSGNSSKEYSYTVRDYAEFIIDNPTKYSSGDVEFAKAMLNYGACAQTYWNVETADLANKNLDEADRQIATLEATALEGYKKYATSNELGTFAGFSLVLKSETTLKAYFKPADGVNVNSLTFTAGGKTVTPVLSGEYYVLSVENIKAWDLDKDYTFTASNGNATLEFSCSALSYGYSVLNNSTSYPDTLIQLISALCVYQQKSEIYITT